MESAIVTPSQSAIAPLVASPDGTDARVERTILCVDDEPNILASLRRLFRSSGHRLLLAGSGAEALEMLAAGPVDLVISDMRMPVMDGARLLEEVRRRWPGTTRVLLTGNSDVTSTIAAINRGEIYRYIAKPWDDDELLLLVAQVFERSALEAEKRRLEALTVRQNAELQQLNTGLEGLVAERTAELSKANERLGRNYLTAIKVFSNLLELRGGQLGGHARLVADLARRIAVGMRLTAPAAQDIFIAGLLHDIGFIALPDALLTRPEPRMTPDELKLYQRHPVVGEQALIAFEDMHNVAPLIRSHHERVDGRGFPDRLSGAAIPLGARILSVADAYLDHQAGRLGTSAVNAAEAQARVVRGRGTQFDAAVVDAFLTVVAATSTLAAAPSLEVPVERLKAGMVLARDLRSNDGVVLLTAGHVLNDDLIARIGAYAERDRPDLTLVIRVDPSVLRARPAR